MVFMIIIPFLNGYFIGNIPNIFRQTHIYGALQDHRLLLLDCFLAWNQLLREAAAREEMGDGDGSTGLWTTVVLGLVGVHKLHTLW